MQCKQKRFEIFQKFILLFWITIVKVRNGILIYIPHSIKPMLVYFFEYNGFTNVRLQMLNCLWFVGITFNGAPQTNCPAVSNLMVFSFLQRRCHPLARCIKKTADQPCYNVIFNLRKTDNKY